MQVPEERRSAGRGRRTWTRRYPPLAGAVVSAILAAFALPSALNVPQTNPTESLEFAPVPSQGDQSTPPAGNVGSLGLGQSAGLGVALRAGGRAEPLPRAPGLPGGVGARPSTKRCVGSPPRQTEDPLSPPCAAFFDGDNGGVTYPGVSRDEVRLLLVFPAGCFLTSSGVGCPEPGSYYDLGDPPRDDDPYSVRIARTYQRYFNDRYQTYGRFVRFFVYHDAATTTEERRANAEENYQQIRPFAAFDVTCCIAAGDAFVDAIARRGVLNFSALLGRSEVHFRRYPNLLWGFPPTVEQSAERFVSYLCRQVVGRPVSFTGMPADMGEPRKLGLLYTDDPQFPEIITFTDIVREGVRACGGTFVEERANSPNQCVGTQPQDPPERPAANMAAFQAASVTTIVWTQCWESNNSNAAAAIGYQPEWLIAGDGIFEATSRAQQQNQDVMAHGWIVTHVTLRGDLEDEPCYQAQREADPDAPRFDVETYGCGMYDSLRQLFTGVQVAGPRLTPATMSRGFRAIPPHASTDPSTPACFYAANDYSCVKDGIAMWWDPDAHGQGSGCWRVPQRGRRFLEGDWERADVIARKTSTDPCNGYNTL